MTRLTVPEALQLHMIGNAHIDPVWLWRWPEGCAEAISTCWSAIDRLEEEPGFIFTRGEAVIYRWIEELEPALFARIQEYVAKKRWIIVNGWWLQADCNLPAGEAFIRQALYGKRYFREKFGIDVTVGYNVDSFGHAGTLPMLLRHTGFDSYVFLRPEPHEKTLPSSLFAWTSPDGSQVTAFRVPFGYNVSESISERIKDISAMAQKAGYPFMCFYGVGNHGGGPTRATLAVIRDKQEEGHALGFSDPRRYFAAVTEVPRPRVDGEIQYHAIGCYAAVSALKALNRRAEAGLVQAEAGSVLASLAAEAPYPYEKVSELWKKLLFNQFHDTLGGTCIESATRDAIEALGGIIQDAEEIRNTALRKLAATITPGADPTAANFLVFNLTGTEQELPVEYEPWLRDRVEQCRLCDESGSEFPYQTLPAESQAAASRIRRILFTARVPSFGYRAYSFASGQPAAVSSTLKTSAHTLESSRWRLEIDPQTGSIASLRDKLEGREIFAGRAHCPLVVADPSDTWSHGLDRFGYEGESFVCEQVALEEKGPVRASMRVRARASAAIITSTYYVYDDPALPLEIRVHLDWRGKNQLLRLCYPLSLPAANFRYEVPYGSLERPANGQEYPGQRWVLASGSDGYGFALANDAKYSYAALENTLYITALRSPVFAHHNPYALQPGNEYAYTDQGIQEFTLRLQAGREVDALRSYRLADGLTQAPTVIPHVARGGKGPQRASLLAAQANSSLITCLKAAEDRQGLILRLLEVGGLTDTLTLKPAFQQFTLAPYSIATLRTAKDGAWRESDGLETER
ncbi:alpha-mannosidase [Ktedonosporobacter rubrisoli]|uniref:alpha-mannosidase n=1 Tax=Ktedonosporobacter rubrisoli TaxID=2509675 RepID=UPI0013EE4CEB|nr:alpha-mannosidase [Ktedonosporobacter rubrisoli]